MAVKIDLAKKKISLGVGDLVAEPMAGAGRVAGLRMWTRLALGREAHVKHQRAQAELHEGYAQEIFVRYTTIVDEFKVTVQGRIDGVIVSNRSPRQRCRGSQMGDRGNQIGRAAASGVRRAGRQFTSALRRTVAVVLLSTLPRARLQPSRVAAARNGHRAPRETHHTSSGGWFTSTSPTDRARTSTSTARLTIARS